MIPERQGLLDALAGRVYSGLLDSVQCCDWRDLLRAIPAGSVDLLLTDMPYGITACDWDKRPDLDEWWRLVKPVMKPRGAVVCTASQPFTSMLVMSNLKWFRYEWVWEKSLPTGYLNASRVPLKRHENVLIFYQRSGNYVPQFTTGEPYRAMSGTVAGVVRDKSVGGWLTENNGRRYPVSVIQIDSETDPRHPTQKPLALLDYLIRTYTQPGDLVVDPFVGSGTTAVAARNTGRHWIVGDLDAGYCEIARRRQAEPYTLPMFADEAEPVSTAWQPALFADEAAR
jgi:site-specific DNA-methyltransferase (adenine-specific)